uniref:Ectonucleotide pyrophosphatase/phosphodiesterase 7 n=1 Tax=Pygocentrus nattereri TaxID=42514 RepID=A0AAR2KB75_PYGNA
MLWVVCVFLCVCARSLAVPVAGPRISSRSKVLLVSFDGFRWDYDRDVDTPHLDAMARDGVKAPYVTPAFITVTSPTHFTILTVTYHFNRHNSLCVKTNLISSCLCKNQVRPFDRA